MFPAKNSAGLLWSVLGRAASPRLSPLSKRRLISINGTNIFFENRNAVQLWRTISNGKWSDRGSCRLRPSPKNGPDRSVGCGKCADGRNCPETAPRKIWRTGTRRHKRSGSQPLPFSKNPAFGAEPVKTSAGTLRPNPVRRESAAGLPENGKRKIRLPRKILRNVRAKIF